MKLSATKKTLAKMFATAAAGGMLFFPNPGEANFSLIDDFEFYPPGSVVNDPGSPWTAHANSTLIGVLEDGTNKYLGFGWTSNPRGGSRALPPGTEIGPGDRATLFLQFRSSNLIPGTSEEGNFGLTHNIDTTANTPFDDYRVHVRLTPGETSAEQILSVRDGADWRELATIFSGSWYNLWLVVDRTDDDGFEVYLNAGDNDATGAHRLSADGGAITRFAFRDGGSTGETVDGLAAISHSRNQGSHLDNIWIDNTGENLAFMGVDFDVWQTDFNPLNAPLALEFGQSSTSDDGSDLLRPRQSDFTLQFDALRLDVTSPGFVSTMALASVENYQERQNFTLTVDVTPRQLFDVGANRIGLAVLGQPHTPFESPFNAQSNLGYYGLVWNPAQDGETSVIQIRQGFNGSILTQDVWEGLHPNAENQGQGGLGTLYTMKAVGTYDASGLLTLEFELTDTNNHTQTISTTIFQPNTGNLFGFGGYLSNEVQPRFDFHTLNLTLDGDPVDVTDPVITWPFAAAFGSDEGLDDDDFLGKSHAEDWTLQSDSLRFDGGGAADRPSLAVANVFNYEGGEAFGLNTTATLTALDGAADNRFGLVVFGDASPAVFDAANDATYFTLQWLMDEATGGSLVFRRGMNGEILASADLADADVPPSLAAGQTYSLSYVALTKNTGELVFVATLTDELGGEVELLGELEEAPEGRRFGVGGWSQATTSTVWDVRELSMGLPSGVGVEALFTNRARVTGFAHNPSFLAYAENAGNGVIGSEGGGGNRRHHNVVLGFLLPNVPLEKIVRFEIAITRETRADVPVHLYALVPEDPSTYSDGSVTTGADGVDVWYQGADPDERADLVGAVWTNFLPSGADGAGLYRQDVTDYILTLYDENGPKQEKIFFRLSPGATVALNNLQRTEIQENFDHPDSPRLNYVIFPPEDPEALILAPFAYNLGTGEGLDGAEDFTFGVPGDWTLLENGIRLETASETDRAATATGLVANQDSSTPYGVRTRFSLAGVPASGSDARVALVVLGNEDRDIYDPEDDGTFHTFQLLPSATGGPRAVVRRGMTGEILSEVALSGATDAPAITAGGTYDLDFRGIPNGAGGLSYRAILSDAHGRAVETAGTIDGPLGDLRRFGFGARHRDADGLVVDFHDLVMVESWKVDYEPVVAPFAREFGTTAGREDLSGFLLSRPEEWEMLEEAASYIPLGQTWTSNGAILEVDNYQRNQNFTLETEVTLTSANVASPSFHRVGFAVLGSNHRPYDDPFNPTDEAANYYGMSWFLQGNLRIRLGYNGSQLIQENLPIPVIEGGLYRLKAEGTYQPDGSLVLTLSVVDPNMDEYTASTTVENPLEGNMFGFGGRSFRDSSVPVHDFHNFSLDLGDVVEPDGPTFAEWRSRNFSGPDLDDDAVSGPFAAPDGDNISNFLKYASGLEAGSLLSSGDLSSATWVDGDLLFTYRELADALDVEHVVEVSNDLVNWDSGPGVVEEISREPAGDADNVTVRILLPAESERVFVRRLANSQ